MFAFDFTINASYIVNKKPNNRLDTLCCSEINELGEFDIYGTPNQKVNWVVFGNRGLLDVEPYNDDIIEHGNGPYKWLSHKMKL